MVQNGQNGSFIIRVDGLLDCSVIRICGDLIMNVNLTLAKPERGSSFSHCRVAAQRRVLSLHWKTVLGFYLNNSFIFLAWFIPEQAKQLSYWLTLCVPLPTMTAVPSPSGWGWKTGLDGRGWECWVKIIISHKHQPLQIKKIQTKECWLRLWLYFSAVIFCRISLFCSDVVLYEVNKSTSYMQDASSCMFSTIY